MGEDGRPIRLVGVDDRAGLEGVRLKPHRTDGFKLSNDPLFVEKAYDIVGLYLNPPESAVVLSGMNDSRVLLHKLYQQFICV